MPSAIHSLLNEVLPSREEIRSLRIWDGHIHLTTPGDTPEERLARMIEHADRMGIERVIVSRGIPPYPTAPTPDELRIQNDSMIRAVRHHPERALGIAYLNPHHRQASLDELNRCVRDGPCVGIKLWVAAKANVPNMDALAERARELQAVIFQHTWVKAGGPGSPPGAGNGPNETSAADLAEIAARHPGASFVCMHSGGDWEPGIRALRASPNVALELSGSNPTAGFAEMAVREVGAQRVTYGTDTSGRSISTQLAKVTGAALTREQRYLILGENLRRLLGPILRSKGFEA